MEELEKRILSLRQPYMRAVAAATTPEALSLVLTSVTLNMLKVSKQFPPAQRDLLLVWIATLSDIAEKMAAPDATR